MLGGDYRGRLHGGIRTTDQERYQACPQHRPGGPVAVEQYRQYQGTAPTGRLSTDAYRTTLRLVLLQKFYYFLSFGSLFSSSSFTIQVFYH